MERGNRLRRFDVAPHRHSLEGKLELAAFPKENRDFPESASKPRRGFAIAERCRQAPACVGGTLFRAVGNRSDNFMPRRAITIAAATSLEIPYCFRYLTNPIKLLHVGFTVFNSIPLLARIELNCLKNSLYAQPDNILASFGNFSLSSVFLREKSNSSQTTRHSPTK